MRFEARLPKEESNVTPVHPLREMGFLLTVITVAALIFLAAGFFFVDIAVHVISPKAEQRFFSSISSSLKKNQTTKVDPQRAMLQALLQRLVKQWPDAPYKFHIAVMDDEKPNALAFPGGMIYVTRGLLKQVKSENALAFVIGHELGHFRNRDHLRGLGKALLFSLLWSSFSGSRSPGTSTYMEILTQLSLAGHSRRQESQADAFGLSLVYKLYGHLQCAPDFFSLMEKKEAKESRFFRSTAAYLRSHPYSNKRRARLLALALKNNWPLQGKCIPRAVKKTTRRPPPPRKKASNNPIHQTHSPK